MKIQHNGIHYWVAAGLLLAACSSNAQRPQATNDAVAAKAPEASELPAKLPAPPGEPGPFLVRLHELFPSQIFAASATPTHIALAMQSDVRDITQCRVTNLPVCFRGTAVIAPRTNPNTPVRINLYESDTQSGARVDDIAAAGNRFAFAVREGMYVGDTPMASVIIANDAGNIEHQIVLSSTQNFVEQVALSSTQDHRVLMCAAVRAESLDDDKIICEQIDLSSAKREPYATIPVSSPVRAFDVAVHGKRALAVYEAGGHVFAVFLDKPSEHLDLGASTAMRPLIAAGWNHFAVAWQADDGMLIIDDVDAESKNIQTMARRTIALNGVKDRSISGLAAVSEGYIFGFRHQNTQQIALVDSDFSAWSLLDNSNVWRMFSDYGVLDTQEAHAGKIFWQTAESLFQPL